MPTHDYVIDNQTAPNTRADINNALAAIVSQNSNATAPTVTHANMIWYDTTNNQLKKRNEANSAWVVLGTIDEVAGTFTPSGGTTVIATQAEAEAGADNTKMMTPLRVSQAITALTGLKNIVARTSTGAFTVPAGVTSIYIYAAGGGGGGAAGFTVAATRGQPERNYLGGTGGRGGEALSLLSVTPGDIINYTIGAGGAGNNSSGGGSSGGSTTIDTITCTGGTGGGTATSSGNGTSGTEGTGSGGNLSNNTGIESLLPLLVLGTNIIDDGFALVSQSASRARATSSTAAVPYAYPGPSTAGAGGQGESGSSSNNAAGGVGGGVIFMY
jgi:hypothetical protein